MPYKSDNIPVGKEYDRRRKLTDEQYEEIRHKYATGEYSYNKLAKEYGVSKKLILLIVNQESRRKNNERIKEHWREYKDSNEKRREVMKEHRAYKKKLYDEGKIGNK